MTDIAKVAIQADTTGLKKGAIALKNFKKVGEDTQKSLIRTTNGLKNGFYSLTPAIKQTSTAAAAAAPKMQGFGHQARMVSMQLSQVAQQGSVTGNYLQALAIQLPDLMLGFGTLGILIGAAAGALAGPLVNALTGSSKELKTFNELIDETKEGLQSVRLETTAGAIDTLKDNIKEASEEMERLQNIPDKMGGRALSNARRLKIQAERLEEINKLEKEQEKNLEALAVLEKRRADIAAETNDTEAAAAAEKSLEIRKKAQEDLTALEQSLESPAQRAQRLYAEELAVIKAAEEQKIESIRPYKELTEQIEKEHSKKMLDIKRQEEAQKYQILTAGQQAGLSITAGLFGQMAAIAREGGKEQFQDYKNLATAEALISTSLAINKTLASVPAPYNIALATAVGAMGAVQVGMIQNQSYQGARAMGGQVEGGGRYLVGENGPEVLQLGSQGGNVTPNHALEGGGASVTTVVNIQAGVTKAEVASLIPTIVSASTNAVKAELGKGGSMSKSVRLRA